MKKSIHLLVGIVVWFFFMGTAFAFQPFPDTGQTMCYDADNQEVSCDSIQPGDSYYGQDAHYQPRIPRSYTKLGQGGVVLPDNALHVYEGGPWIMTRDNVTGLIWEVETIRKSRWNTAQVEFYDELNAENFGGFSDWRMPTIKELSSLFKSDARIPGIDLNWFPNTKFTSEWDPVRSYWYWSSTISRVNPWMRYILILSFNDGEIYSYEVGTHDYYDRYVRAVRGGHSPSSSLVDNDNGTVTDHTTGLMWQKYTAPSRWTDEQYTWEQALVYAESLNLGGHTDWRLPNRNELHSLVDNSFYSPAIYPILESHTLANPYWTSTTGNHFSNTSGFSDAFRVSFLDGKMLMPGKSASFYVRAVRGGQDLTKGTIRIDIEPDGAVVAGAQWRIQGTTIWRNSGTMIIAPIGNHTIEFMAVPGWRPEGTITLTVQANKTTTATGFYLEQAQARVLPGVMMLLLDDE